jgi:CDP-4-dehydro-6-deoxyglucose reductase, E1
VTPPYQLAANTLGEEEMAAARAVLASGRLTMGESVGAFEREIAEWTGARYALMVNSGSSANLLMVDAMLRRSDRDGLWQPGDEVLVPALAWPTTVWPLCQLGLTPVFVDVDPATLALDLASAEEVLSPRTRGMFLIHVLGQVPDLTRIQAFCARHRIELLEDACESLGAHHGGKHVGNFASMGSFSCYFSHHISTIEGGVIITSDAALHDDLRSLRAHGWVRDRSDKSRWVERHPDIDPRFMFVTGGYNVRPMEIQGAIGRVQLARLDSMLDAREKLAREVHDRLLRAAPWLELIGAARLSPEGPPADRRARTHSWMTLPMRVAAGAPLDAAGVKAHLEKMGVETRPIIAGNLARHPGVAQFKTRRAASLRRADELLESAFMIGCHPVSSDGSHETLMRAVDSLASFSS